MAKKTSNHKTKLFTSDYFYSHCATVFLHFVFIPFYTIGIGVQCLCFHISMMAFSYTHVTNLGLFIDGRIGFSLSCHNKNKKHRDQTSWIGINSFYNTISFGSFMYYNQYELLFILFLLIL